MSLRRRSCDACFKSRRKCDFGYPSCSTCQRTKKSCRYAYAPVSRPATRAQSVSSPWSTDTDAAIGVSLASSTTSSSLTRMTDRNTPETHLEVYSLSEFSFDQYEGLSDTWATPLLGQSISQGISLRQLSPSLLGSLGEVQPIEGSSESWKWAMDQLKSYPREFAQRSQTLFIHPQLYHDSMPKAIRIAFGMSSAYCFINESNRTMLFRAVDAEVLDLLQDCEKETSLLDELSRVQALTLYQTMRLFQGGIEQRVLAEQQQTVLMASALKLLTRSQVELHDAEAVCWRSWILAECIRRTAFVVYMLYGINSIFRQGICIGFNTLAKLPMSTALACWDSEIDHRNQSEPGGTITYEMFTEGWLAMPRKLRPFERFLLIPCKGINVIKAYDDAGIA